MRVVRASRLELRHVGKSQEGAFSNGWGHAVCRRDSTAVVLLGMLHWRRVN